MDMIHMSEPEAELVALQAFYASRTFASNDYLRAYAAINAGCIRISSTTYQNLVEAEALFVEAHRLGERWFWMYNIALSRVVRGDVTAAAEWLRRGLETAQGAARSLSPGAQEALQLYESASRTLELARQQVGFHENTLAGPAKEVLTALGLPCKCLL